MAITRYLKKSFLFTFLVLTVSISNAQATKDTIIYSTKFISLAGYSVKIPYSVVKNCTNFKIASGFTLKKAFLYINDTKSFSQPMRFVIEKNEFDPKLITLLANITPGWVISVSPIVLINPHGKNIELSGISYSVTY